MKKINKVILVTGATGFLGGAITKRLLVLGYELRLLIRKRQRNRSVIEDFILNNHIDESLYGLLLGNVEIFENCDHFYIDKEHIIADKVHEFFIPQKAVPL
jgi:nucleoside-diphosphate-sugar epimerase